MVLAILALTSCGGRDAAGGNKLGTMIQIKSSQDLIDAYDIEVTYKGKGGVDVIDTITSTRWKKVIVNDTFPTETGLLGYRFLPKPNPKNEKDRCQLDFEIIYVEKPMRLGTTALTQWSHKPFDIDDIASSKVASYLELKGLQPQMYYKGSCELSAHKVILKDGQFETVDTDVNPEECNEPSNEIEQ